MFKNGGVMDKKWEEFRTAYVAWEVATTKYQKAMRAILEKEPTENFHIDDLIEDMAQCKLRFDLAAKPFTRGI